MSSGATEGDSNQAESSSGSGSGDSSTVEIKIRTLDSASHSIRVNKDISVPALKQHLEPLVGVPAQEQRLICRGKVLKDDQPLSAYDVEDGHTLHLVARAQAQSQPAEPQGEQANDQGQTDTNQMGRPGQVTHSLLVGTINVPTVGDGGMPDFSRIVSAVLGSVGNLPGQNAPSGPADMQQAGGQALPPRLGLSFGGNQFQGFQVPSDALTTMAIYLSRLEQMFGIVSAPAQNLNQPSNQSLNQTSNQMNQIPNPPVNQSPPPPPASDDPTPAGQRSPAVDRPSMSPAALGAIIRRAQSLLTGQGATLLNALAGQLENEVSLTDVNMRGEVHTAAAWSGTVMQQLGALLMELGRTTLTLHMGSSPGEALVNSGPAVFLSPSGPNPMMVQPMPFQPIGAFPARASFPSAGWPSAPGPRSLNIHIHTSDVGIIPTANASSVPPSTNNGSQVPMPGAGGQENSVNAVENNNSQAMPSAVVQETIMVIQDNGDARVLSSRATNLSSETTPPLGINSTTEGNTGVPMQAGSTAQMAQVSQALRQLWPEGFRPPQQVNMSSGSNPLSSMLGATLGQLTGMQPGLPSQGQPHYNPFVPQQGSTPALAQAQVSMPQQPATVPPPQPFANDVSATSQPASDSSSVSRDALTTSDHAAANTSASATNNGTSPAQPNTSLPAGLGLGRLRPLVPRRRADASSHNESGDSPGSRTQAPPPPPPPPVGDSNLTGLIGSILRNPAFGNFAQQMMQSLGEGGAQHSADIGNVFSQLRGGAVQQQQQPTNVNVPDANCAHEGESIKTQNSSESTLEKLESGAPAGEVTRSVVEAAATNAATPLSDSELSELANDLSDDYMALILQDLASRL